MTLLRFVVRFPSGASLSLLALLSLFSAACEPGQVREGLAPDDTAPSSVAVRPDRSTIAVGEAVLIRASARTASGQATTLEVDWSTDGGSLTAISDTTAQFSASTAGTYKVKGRGRRNQSLQDSTSITVLQPVSPVIRISVSPKPASASTGGIMAFVATATRQDGTSLPASVTWSASGGTITQSGVYTGGVNPGNFRVIATEQGGTLADTSAISLVVPPAVLQAVIITPSTATLVAGASQQFSVSGQWSDGSTLAPPVTFAATGGTVSASGLYTAGTAPGTYRVIATHQGGTLADTSTVTVSPAPAVLQAVILTPASASILTGASQQFAVSGQWSDGSTTAPAVTYSAAGGTITGGGLYTAGSTPGTYRVIATQQGGTLADTSTVTVSAPVLQAVILTPTVATIATGGSQQFTVSGQWSNGATTAPIVTYSATGGTITSGGLYSAGSTAGTYRVIATHQSGSLADTSIITLTAPVLQAIILSPSSITMTTGSTQQFTVSGLWSNGGSTPPAVTYSATGGTVSSAGLYTAGSTSGTFRVIVVQQGGTLADTALVSVISQGSGPYPNRPASFANAREIDFSQAVPAFTTSGDRPIAGVSFAVLYDYTNSPDGQSNFTRMTDPTAPQSPSGVWRLHFMPGTWTDGHGVGNIFTTGSLPGAPSALYVSLWHKVDANYPWHAISNKFLYMVPGQVLVQLREGSKWLHGESLGAGQWLDNANGPLNGAQLLVYKNDPVTAGVWHHYEVLVDKVAGTFKIWMDGDLKTSAINVRFTETYFDQVMLTGHRGGGGETLTQDGYWYYDHLTIAWP